MEQCSFCKEKYKKLKENDNFTFKKINNYTKFIDKEYINVEPIEIKFKENVVNFNYGKRRGVFNMFKKYKRYAVAVSLILVLTVVFAVQPVRAAVYDVLSIFRADNVKGISISMKDIREISEKIDSKNPEIDIEKFGKIKTAGGKQINISIDELASEKGINIINDSNSFTADQSAYYVSDFKMDFQLNIPNINKFMESYGAKTLLPKSLDGKTFSVHVPEQIYVTYNKDGVKFSFLQYKKPEIVAPSEKDVEKVRLALLDLPFLPNDLVEKLEAIKDWKSTLYIPAVGMDVKEINLNGKKASLFTDNEKNKYKNQSSDMKMNTALLWNDNENIYTIWTSAEKDDVIELYNLLR